MIIVSVVKAMPSPSAASGRRSSNGPSSGDPIDTTIRPAVVTDAAALAVLEIVAWRAAYRGVLSSTFLGGLEAGPLRRHWHRRIFMPQIAHLEEIHVAVRNDVVVGYCTHHRFVDPIVIGEVMELYVDPAQKRQGLGRALLETAVARLDHQRCEDIVIRVLEDNAAAHAFYAAAGFVKDPHLRQRRASPPGLDGGPVVVVQFARRRPAS